MSDDDQRPVAPGADGPDPGPKGEARPTHSGGRPGLLVLALVLVAMQALGLVVLALAGLGGLVGLPAAGQITIVTLAVVLLGLAALIGAAGWALWQGRRWGRGPVVTWQLLLVAIGVSGFGADAWWATVLPALSALVVLVGVLAPASRRATERRGRPDAVL